MDFNFNLFNLMLLLVIYNNTITYSKSKESICNKAFSLNWNCPIFINNNKLDKFLHNTTIENSVKDQCFLIYNRPLFNRMDFVQDKNETAFDIKYSNCYQNKELNSTVFDNFVIENQNLTLIFPIYNTIYNHSYIFNSTLNITSDFFKYPLAYNKGVYIYFDTDTNKLVYYFLNGIYFNTPRPNFPVVNGTCPKKDVIIDNYNEGSKTYLWTNCIDAEMGSMSNGWFRNYYRYNYAGWVVVILTLFYFIYTLSCEQETTLLPSMENNSLYLIPIYSVFTFGSMISTKNRKLTSLYMTIISQFFFISMLYNKLLYVHPKFKREEYIPLIIFIGILFSIPFNWINAWLISKIDNATIKFIRKNSKSININVRNNIEEEYLNNYTTYNFIFYFFNLVIFWILACLGIMYVQPLIHEESKFSNDWIMMVLVAWGIDLLVFDSFIALLGSKISKLKNIIKLRGFYLDYKKEENFKMTDFDFE